VNFDPAVFAFYQSAIALRKAHPMLATGDVRFIGAPDAKDSLVLLRSGAREQLVVVINRSDKPQEIAIGDSGMKLAHLRVIFSTYGESPKLVSGSSGLHVTLPALAGIVCSAPVAH
jgi:glycosidase